MDDVTNSNMNLGSMPLGMPSKLVTRTEPTSKKVLGSRKMSEGLYGNDLKFAKKKMDTLKSPNLIQGLRNAGM